MDLIRGPCAPQGSLEEAFDKKFNVLHNIYQSKPKINLCILSKVRIPP